MPGGEKKFYTSSHAVCSQYLCCLLLADKLVGDAEGQVAAIPHWSSKPSQVYGAILRGEPIPQQAPRPALCDDVEHGEPAALPERFPESVVVDPDVQAGVRSPDVQSDGVASDVLLAELEQMLSDDVLASEEPAAVEEIASSSQRVDDAAVQPPSAEASVEPLPAAEEAQASRPRPTPRRDAAPEMDQEEAMQADFLSAVEPFGPFKFSYKKLDKKAGRPFGGLEISCPYHKKVLTHSARNTFNYGMGRAASSTL